MIKEYKTIREIASPLMVVEGVAGVSYDELVEIELPSGDKRRGKVLGMNPAEHKKGYSIIEAEVPKAEMGTYTIQLRAVSQGRGTFSYEFDRYAEAPANVAAKIIENAKLEEEA